MAIPAVSIYASFILSKHELELRGPLSQQIIRFTTIKPDDIEPHVRVDNVTMERLVSAIKKNLCNYFEEYRILSHQTGFQGCTLLYAIPTVRIFENHQYNLVSSHKGARTVLMRALKDLCCKYAILTPDIRLKIDREDPKGYWTLTASISNDSKYHILKAFPGKDVLTDNTVVDPTVALLWVENVQLADILYVAQYKSELTPHMTRWLTYPYILTATRHFEKFSFHRTPKTSQEILNDFNTELINLTNRSQNSLFSFSRIIGWAYECLWYYQLRYNSSRYTQPR